MSVRISYSYPKGKFEKNLREMNLPVAKAATDAILEVRQTFETAARANIAAAGFSRRWQTGYRVLKFPRGAKPAIDVAAFGYHKIGYANVFERGAKVSGKPLLWLPLPGAPKKIGREKVTPKLYAQKVGPLQYVSRPGKAPLLLGKKSGRGKKLSLKSLRRGASGAGKTSMVPLFVGLKAVSIGSKFDISAVAERVAARLPEIYHRHFQAGN